MSTLSKSIVSKVHMNFSSSALPTSFTIPTGVEPSLNSLIILNAVAKCSLLPLLLGLYKHITKSASAANLNLFSITSHGVIKSLKLIWQKSCIIGAPNTAAAPILAVPPGTTLTATFLPVLAISIASWHLSTSFLIPF